MRSPTIKNVDAEIFRRTASTTKSINLGARIYRGGTRLWNLQDNKDQNLSVKNS